MSLMLDNLWQWLSAAPAASKLGGYTTNLTRLMFSNEIPGAMDAYNETNRQWPEQDLEADPSLWCRLQATFLAGLHCSHAMRLCVPGRTSRSTTA